MKKNYVLPVFFFAVAYLLPSAFRPLIPPVEYRYANPVRQILADSGGGGFDIGHYPAAVSCWLLGENAFALRLPSALAVLLTAGVIGLLLYRYTRDHRIASLGGLLYLSFGSVYAVGTTAGSDSLYIFMVTVSLAAFLPACLKKHWSREKIVLLLLSGAAVCGVALLRGPTVWVLPLIVIVPFLIWEKRWCDFYRLPILLLGGAMAALLLGMLKAAPGEPLLPMRSWWWPWLLLAGVLPGGLLGICAVAGLRRNWRELVSRSYIRFMLCWLVLPPVFLMVAGGHPGNWLLPCFVPLAVLGAVGIASYFRSGGAYRIFRWTMDGLGGGLLLAGPVLVFVLVLPWVWIYNGWGPEPILAQWFPASVLLPVAMHLLFFWGAVLLGLRKRGWKVRYTVFFCGLALVLAVSQAVIPGRWGYGRVLIGWQAEVPENAVIVCGDDVAEAVRWCWDRKVIRWCWDRKMIRAASFKNGDWEQIPVRGAGDAVPVVLVNQTDFFPERGSELPPASYMWRSMGVEMRLYLPPQENSPDQE